jgi:pimeloyl-ACP methyl ester carboxylesterase
MGQGAVGVALAHGALTTKESWYAAMNALADAGYRVVAFDARGVGKSTGTISTDPDQRARDIEAVLRFLERQGAHKVVVMGSSLGAYAAILVAERGGVAAVVGVSPAAVPGGLAAVNVPAFFLASKGDRGPAGNARLLGHRLGRPPRVVGGSIHGADLFTEHPEAVRALVAFLTRVVPARS